MSEWFKNFFATEHAKLKDMTFKEKASYIWEYYKIPIIAVIAAIIVIGSIINSVWINPAKKMYLQIAFYGEYVDDNAITAMCNQLGDAVMTPEDQQTMQISGASFMENTGDPQMDMAYQQKFAAMLSDGELDLIIINASDLDDMASQGILAPIKNYLSDSLLPQLSDKLAEAPDENGNNDYYAINLDNVKLFNDNGLITDGMCLGVVVNTTKPDNVKSAIDYIFIS